LPRQKAQQVGQSDDAAADEATEPAAEVAAPELTEPSAEATEATEAVVVAESKPRRRLPWKRDKAVVATAAPVPADEEVSQAPAAEATETVEPTVDTETPQEPEKADEPEVVLVPHRTAGRALKIAAVAAGALFIAAAAFAGATIQPYLADRAAVHTKFVIAETAASAITTLWTYTPEDMEKLPDRSAKYLGGDFAADYKRYIDAIVAPNKQAQVTNNTQVLGAAVESLTPTEATAIVYTNSVATSPVTKGIPSLRYLSYRLTMKPRGNNWLITQMVAVTKLDLTPRL
jgi:Mce-associated membrane protein